MEELSFGLVSGEPNRNWNWNRTNLCEKLAHLLFLKEFLPFESFIEYKEKKTSLKVWKWTFVWAGFVKRIKTVNVCTYKYYVLSSWIGFLNCIRTRNVSVGTNYTVSTFSPTFETHVTKICDWMKNI